MQTAEPAPPRRGHADPTASRRRMWPTPASAAVASTTAGSTRGGFDDGGFDDRRWLRRRRRLRRDPPRRRRRGHARRRGGRPGSARRTAGIGRTGRQRGPGQPWWVWLLVPDVRRRGVPDQPGPDGRRRAHRRGGTASGGGALSRLMARRGNADPGLSDRTGRGTTTMKTQRRIRPWRRPLVLALSCWPAARSPACTSRAARWHRAGRRRRGRATQPGRSPTTAPSSTRVTGEDDGARRGRARASTTRSPGRRDAWPTTARRRRRRR